MHIKKRKKTKKVYILRFYNVKHCYWAVFWEDFESSADMKFYFNQ